VNHPLLLALLTIAGLWIARLWRDDLRASQVGRTRTGAFPGATPAPRAAIAIAIGGGLVLVGAETLGEIALGVAAEQSQMTWLFALYSITAAPVFEELIFRGWVVVENQGRAALWAAALAASVVFAALHPFLWQWDQNSFGFTLGRKGWFSTVLVFASSIWFYAARFGPWNPQRSLLPCFAAHAIKNLGVVAVKAASGFIGGLW
jgi:hypothetical protein